VGLMAERRRGRSMRTVPRDRPCWKVERCCAWTDNGRRLVVGDARAVEHDRAFCLLAIIWGAVHLMPT
jgi:hypothetical protein